MEETRTKIRFQAGRMKISQQTKQGSSPVGVASDKHHFNVHFEDLT